LVIKSVVLMYAIISALNP